VVGDSSACGCVVPAKWSAERQEAGLGVGRGGVGCLHDMACRPVVVALGEGGRGSEHGAFNVAVGACRPQV
jgi:hypothetical protein